MTRSHGYRPPFSKDLQYQYASKDTLCFNLFCISGRESKVLQKAIKPVD